MGSTIRRLAPLNPNTLALMQGPSFHGDGAAALNALPTTMNGAPASAGLT